MTSCRSPSRSRASCRALAELFEGTDEGITEENLQSRTRGTILMAISNKFGSMVVTTGNKSEMSVGYATLYGDMNGGFNPIKDLYKMQVYAIADWRNKHTPPNVLGPTGDRHPAEHHRQGTVSGACGPIRPTRIPCHPIRCSTTSSNASSSRK
jgi:NAD+ synthetase